MEYGKQLNPAHFLRMTRSIKGTRQKVIIEMNQNQLLLVRFPNLESDDVTIPGIVNLSFNTKLSSMADLKRMLVSNIGRAIVKKLAVKLKGNELLDADNFDMFACYRDL